MSSRTRKMDQTGDARFVIYAKPEYGKSCDDFKSSTTGRYFGQGYITTECEKNGRGRIFYTFYGTDISSKANRKKRQIQQKGIVEEIQFTFDYH